MCFAPGQDFDGRFGHFDLQKVLFPLLVSNLYRKDMKHFVRKKPRMQMVDLLQQTSHEMQTILALCQRSYG